jgi:hypothetical protein
LKAVLLQKSREFGDEVGSWNYNSLLQLKYGIFYFPSGMYKKETDWQAVGRYIST